MHAHTHKERELERERESVSDKALCFQLEEEEEVWLDEEQQALVEELKMEILEERRKRAERNFDRGDEVRVKARERAASKQGPKCSNLELDPLPGEWYLRLLKSAKNSAFWNKKHAFFFSLQA